MKISIFGLGYVGCVSLGCLANKGHKVIGVDVSNIKVNLINSGKPTIIEHKIDTIITKNFKRGRIKATTNYLEAVKDSDISIICVGTPSARNGHLNMKSVYKVAEEIGGGLKKKKNFHVVVIRSTVLPGTNKRVGEIIEKTSKKSRNKDFAVISNPEFMREGTAVDDYYNPGIIVLGSDNKKATKIMKEIHKPLKGKIFEVEIETAEFIKYVNNSFHALKVTFANEIGNICKKLNIDSHKVMEIFSEDKRLNISTQYLKPGFAYGGACLPKDLKALNTLAHDLYLKTPVLESIERSNEEQKDVAFNLIVKENKKNIGFLGLSFKHGTDDLRNSPIVDIIEKLLGKGYRIKIYDKNVSLSELTGTNKEYIEKTIPHLVRFLEEDLNKVIKFADVIVIANKNKKFKEIIKKSANKTVIDLVRIVEKAPRKNYKGICW